MKSMANVPMTAQERRKLLDLFAAVLWQDGALGDHDRLALWQLTRALGAEPSAREHAERALLPPPPERADPTRVPARLRGLAWSLCVLAAQLSPSAARKECLDLLSELLADPAAAPALSASAA